jgi:hypothetical protein
LFRDAFNAVAETENESERKYAICSALVTSIETYKQLKEARCRAIYGYTLGRDGEEAAEQFFSMKNGSKHPRYHVAENAFRRAQASAEKEGWVCPLPPNSTRTGTGLRKTIAT